MGKTVKGRWWRVAGKCHHPRGRGKILLRHMFLCRYVNPRVSLDGIDVFRVGHWGCFCRAHIPYFASVQLRGNRARHALSGRLSAPSSTDISRVSAVAKHRDASLLPPRILSWRHTDKCDGRLRVVLQKEEETRQIVRGEMVLKNNSDGEIIVSVAEL